MSQRIEIPEDEADHPRSPIEREIQIPEDVADPPRFLIEREIQRRYQHFNSVGTQLTVQLLPPSIRGDTNPITHFLASVTDMLEYAVRNVRGSDIVGLTIRNTVNRQDKGIGISFRRRDQLSEDVIGAYLKRRLNRTLGSTL
jgi:hypothetical protein